jgi:cation diffusion facilitator CzcD-associated flavoprotein CzcO
MTDVQGKSPDAGANGATEYDAIVVGAGFAGLYALYRLRELGFSARVFERGDGVGGTWFWNCYPGARCDVESMEYSYSFSEELEQEWEWTEKYPRQPEILKYINHVADRFDLRKDIQLETTVTAASFDDDANRWLVETGDGGRYSAQYCVMAAGCLSSRKNPAEDFKGLDSFEGDWYMTSAWPKEGVDLGGKRVGVIGTGSTAIQAIPKIAQQADHVSVFQRTPNFSVPAQNGPLDPEFQKQLKARYRDHRKAARESAFGVPVALPEKSALEFTPEDAVQELEGRWQEGGAAPFMLAFTDVLIDKDANDVVAEFIRSKIRETVKNPQVAETLCPDDHPVGTKRLCVDTEYFDTYNRDNVTLVNLRKSPIEEITPKGIRTKDGEHELDTIVFAIGFDAMTGALFDIDIRGRSGVLLRDKWADGPRTYLGVATAGFPNMFIITGPGSPSVLSNMVVSIEQHVDWIADCLTYLREHDLDVIEATIEAEDKWVDHVHEVGHSTLFPLANSWYVGANVPGKPRVFTPYVGGVGPYRETCDEVAANDYDGFATSKAAFRGHAPHAEHAGLNWG